MVNWKSFFFPAAAGALSAVAAFLVSCATSPPPTTEVTADLDTPTGAALRRLSDTLAKADQFTFRAVRTMDKALVDYTGLEPEGTVTVKVSRPDRFRGSLVGKGISNTVSFDGNAISIYEKSAGTFATVPVKRGDRSIDGAVDTLVSTYGFAPPLADFVVATPYESMLRNVKTGRRVGSGRVRGADCDHFALTGDEIDIALWTAKSDGLPRKFVITAKAMDGDPKFVAEFLSWDLQAAHSDTEFNFSPPPGAERIEIIPVGQKPEAVEFPASAVPSNAD